MPDSFRQSLPTHWLSTLVSALKFLFILLTIPLLQTLSSTRRERIVQTEQTHHALCTAWQDPWLTSDWPTLYGLIGLSHSGVIPPSHTPFHAPHLTTLQTLLLLDRNTTEEKPERWALKRLLERGVIPLRIQDGGVSITVTQSWSLNPTFPFLGLPRYRQTKKRAYFEFLIPHPEQGEVERLVELLRGNKMGYGVSLRMYDAGTRKTRRMSSNAALSGGRRNEDFPLSVGAESSCEVLLPFLPDEEMESAQDGWVDEVDGYVKKSTVERPRVPLLHLCSWAVVRVEAGHWGHVELDHYVLGAVQDVGMEVKWVGEVCESKAVEEIDKWELDI